MKRFLMNSLRIHLALVLALFFAGCHGVTEADKAAALATVKLNLEAMQERNFDALIATIHSQSPFFEKLKMQTEQLFKRYEIQYELKSAVVESVTRDTIRMRFEQVATKTSGPPDFKSNRSTGVYTLRREGGAWKLWSTDVQQVTYLGNE
jgi:hypothetical protein